MSRILICSSCGTQVNTLIGAVCQACLDSPPPPAVAEPVAHEADTEELEPYKKGKNKGRR